MFSLITVDADHLAPILLCNADFEPVPEPIRLQSDLCLRVPFDEYVSFCADQIRDTDFLYYPSKDMLAFLRNNDFTSLRKAFFFDLSLAVSKELWYAYYRDTLPTSIAHSYKETVDRRDVLNCDIDGAVVNLLISVMAERKFLLPPTFPSKYNSYWRYACYLYQSALAGDTAWAVSRSDIS